MDEGELKLNPGDSLPDINDVYRIVMSSWRDKKNKAIPAVRCFNLSEQDDNKLSVDWSGATTPEESIARVGASYKFKKQEYKNHEDRELYALEISFLKSLKDIDDVIYDPIINHPSVIGKPNNPAHSLIAFNKDIVNNKLKRPEIILKLRNHAKDKKVSVNMELVDKIVKDYRDK